MLGGAPEGEQYAREMSAWDDVRNLKELLCVSVAEDIDYPLAEFSSLKGIMSEVLGGGKRLGLVGMGDIPAPILGQVKAAAFASDYHVLVEANERCAADFGIDQVSCISDPYRETHGFGSAIEYVKDGPPRSTHPLAGTKDLSVLAKPDPLVSVRMLDRIEAARAYGESSGGTHSILGWVEGPAAEAADLRDVITFLVDMMQDEAYACELMDLCMEVGIEFALAQVEAGAAAVGRAR